MEKVLQNYKNWDKFVTNGKVGIITTVFSEQFLAESFDIFVLSKDNYAQEIERNDIDTIFLDNDIFETDHSWYRAHRGHLVNYLTSQKKNLCIIKNTTKEISEMFQNRFVLEICPHIDQYEYHDSVLRMPLLLNTDIYNPIGSSKYTDITYFHLGKINSSFEKKVNNFKSHYITEIIADVKFTRSLFEDLFFKLKNTRILYINNTIQLNEITIRFIEYIAYLSSAFVIFDHNHKLNSIFDQDKGDFRVINNKMTVLLKNPDFTFKKSLVAQRDILINHTFLKRPNLKEFLINSIKTITPSNISVITATHRRENLDFYLDQMNKQKHVNLEINIVTHGYELSPDEVINFKSASKFQVNIFTANKSETLGACLNKAVNSSSFPVIAKIDDDDYYLEHYLIDQWLAIEYSSADVVGKSEVYYYFESEDIIAIRKKEEHFKYGEFIMGATIMIKTDLLKKLLFADLPRAIDTDLLRRVNKNSGRIYIGHPYEMCVFRSQDSGNHTWKVSNLVMLKDAEIVGYGNPSSYVRLK